MLCDQIIGVAAADVRVGNIQSQLQPFLVQLAKNSCVLDQHGVVIATNTGRLLGAARPPDEPAGQIIELAHYGWRLLVGARSQAEATVVAPA